MHPRLKSFYTRYVTAKPHEGDQNCLSLLLVVEIASELRAIVHKTLDFSSRCSLNATSLSNHMIALLTNALPLMPRNLKEESGGTQYMQYSYFSNYLQTEGPRDRLITYLSQGDTKDSVEKNLIKIYNAFFDPLYRLAFDQVIDENKKYWFISKFSAGMDSLILYILGELMMADAIHDRLEKEGE